MKYIVAWLLMVVAMYAVNFFLTVGPPIVAVILCVLGLSWLYWAMMESENDMWKRM